MHIHCLLSCLDPETHCRARLPLLSTGSFSPLKSTLDNGCHLFKNHLETMSGATIIYNGGFWNFPGACIYRGVPKLSTYTFAGPQIHRCNQEKDARARVLSSDLDPLRFWLHHMFQVHNSYRLPQLGLVLHPSGF